MLTNDVLLVGLSRKLSNLFELCCSTSMSKNFIDTLNVTISSYFDSVYVFTIMIVNFRMGGSGQTL